MKPNPIVVAAAGFAMVGACTVEKEENAAEPTDSNAAMTAGESGAAPAVDAGETDTLGNQLNQLNESDAAAASDTENGATNSAE